MDIRIELTKTPKEKPADESKLGFAKCIVPAANLDAAKEIKGIELLAVKNISDALNYI